MPRPVPELCAMNTHADLTALSDPKCLEHVSGIEAEQSSPCWSIRRAKKSA